MDMDLTWSDAARQAAIAARQARAQGRAAAPPQKKQGVPAGQKLPKLNDRQRAGIKYRDVQNNGRVTNKRAGTAIAAFQKAHGLVVTGDLNPATRKLAAKVSQSSTGHHLLAKAVHQIGRAKNGKNWKQNEKRAANLLVKHDKRKMKMKADLSNGGKFTPDTIDLGKDGSKWKHGYIPLNAAAVALKAHKNPGGHAERGEDFDHRTAKYTLHPTGHVIGVDKKTGRVTSGEFQQKGGVTALDAHPQAFARVYSGRSAAHDDHAIFLPHKLDTIHKEVATTTRKHHTTSMHEGPNGRTYATAHGDGSYTVHHVIGTDGGGARAEKARKGSAEEAAAHMMHNLYGGKSKSAPGNIPDADKITNAEKMFGTNSPQHLAAKKRFGGKK